MAADLVGFSTGRVTADVTFGVHAAYLHKYLLSRISEPNIKPRNNDNNDNNNSNNSSNSGTRGGARARYNARYDDTSAPTLAKA